MNCCCYRSRVLHANWWTGREPKEKMFLLCDDDPLLQTDVSLSNKLMDRWRTKKKLFKLYDDDLLLLMGPYPSRTFRDRSTTKGENISTLGSWSVAENTCKSFKEIDGQVENRRRPCFYFEMMNCFCKQNWILLVNWTNFP